MALVKPDLFTAPKGKQPTSLASFYAATLGDKRTQAVLSGDSSMGKLAQYFVEATYE